MQAEYERHRDRRGGRRGHGHAVGGMFGPGGGPAIVRVGVGCRLAEGRHTEPCWEMVCCLRASRHMGGRQCSLRAGWVGGPWQAPELRV